MTREIDWRWVAAILALLALRLPSLVEPAGGDQGLYGYAAQRLLDGGVMYRDMWDQKPPGLSFLYAGLSSVWAGESVVPGADLAAATAVAWCLVVLGRRRFSSGVGYGAAVIFLLLGDPYLQRLSGIYVRGQAEPFIAASIAATLALLADRERGRRHLIAAGVTLAAGFWLKYNAAAYALPAVLALWAWQPGPPRIRRVIEETGWLAVGFCGVTAIVLGYFAACGALQDLRLATIDYNLRYSNETYESRASVLAYLVTMPALHARIDGLWFLGGLGAALLAIPGRWSRSAAVTCGWVAAAVVSIAINGSRSLPNYFVQADPALALTASAGLATLALHGWRIRAPIALVLLLALWRVGSDTPVWGMRLASLPGLVSNVKYDLQYIRGQIDRNSYLARFKGQKHDALENEELVRYIRASTSASDRVFVFGFSGGSVGWKSERASSSRFFWSRPVIIEFAADRRGYGSAGLLDDLRRNPPALVALQKEEWRSREFFMQNAPLRAWLETGYTLDHETTMFAVWRRR
jgi:hypothetical protein